MKLKKPNPGNGQCDAMRCRLRPTVRHVWPDGTMVELCKRHSDKARAEYTKDGLADSVEMSPLGPQCGHEECYKHFMESGFVSCTFAAQINAQAGAVVLPEPEILEPEALDQIKTAQTKLTTLTQAAFVRQLQADAQEQQAALELVQRFQIQTADDFAFMESVVKDAKELWDQYEQRRTSFSKPANAILRQFNGWFKPVLGALKSIEQTGKHALLRYRAAQEQEKQRLLAEAQAAQDPKAIQTAVVAASEAIPEPTTTTYIDHWVFEVFDPNALPREYLMPDLAAIKAAVKQHKGQTSIPGVKVWNQQIVRSE